MKIKMMSVRGDQKPPMTFEDICDEDLLPGGDQDSVAAKRPTHAEAIRNEVQYTPDIEKVLQDLPKENQPLQVTHTVSLQEIRKSPDAWSLSAWKEFKNLTESKEAFCRSRNVTYHHRAAESFRAKVSTQSNQTAAILDTVE